MFFVEPFSHGKLFGEFLRLFADSSVVGVARPAKQGFDLIVGNAFNKTGLTDPRIAAAFSYFTHRPLEIFQRLIAARHHVDGVFDRDRANPLQPKPDLGVAAASVRKCTVAGFTQCFPGRFLGFAVCPG